MRGPGSRAWEKLKKHARNYQDDPSHTEGRYPSNKHIKAGLNLAENFVEQLPLSQFWRSMILKIYYCVGARRYVEKGKIVRKKQPIVSVELQDPTDTLQDNIILEFFVGPSIVKYQDMIEIYAYPVYDHKGFFTTENLTDILNKIIEQA